MLKEQSEEVQKKFKEFQLDVIKEEILIWYLGILEASIGNAFVTEEQYEDLHLIILLTLTDERDKVVDSGSEILYRLLRNFSDIKISRTAAEYDGHAY